MTRGAETPYEILGISPEASLEEIRQAYRRGALRYHPDNYRQSPLEAEKKFRKLAKAYKTALRTHLPKYEGNNGSKPYSPADFARMNTKWHSGRTHDHYIPEYTDDWPMQNIATSRSVATVDENRVFVLAWALATVLGIAIVVLSTGTLGMFGHFQDGMELSNILAIEMMAILIVGALLAGAIYGIALTRKTIWLTLQWGIRLLPFLPYARKPKQLPKKAP